MLAAPGAALAKHCPKSKVYKGSFEYVGADGDYVTGKFGKVQLVDGKRNDKLSVHVRRLARRRPTSTGSSPRRPPARPTRPGGTDVPGWTYRKLKTSRSGVGERDGPFTHVHGEQDAALLRRRLPRPAERRAGRAHPLRGAQHAQGQEEAGQARQAGEAGQAREAGQAGQARGAEPPPAEPAEPAKPDDKPRGKSDDAPRGNANGQDKDKPKSKGKPSR